MSTQSTLTLDPDELDELIYLCRTGDLTELKETLTNLSSQKHNGTPISTILRSTIDIDSEGLGSQSCLLHYPAANGNVEVVKYLLEQAASGDSSSAVTQPEVNGSGTENSSNTALLSFVNHRNVSGNTALHWAAMNGHLEVVKALVQIGGADPTLVNGAGRDAVVEAEWSTKDGSDECVNWMLQECADLMTGVGNSERRNGEEQMADITTEGEDEEVQANGTAAHVNGAEG